MVGQCLVKHWAKTQTTVSLSSGEAELQGIAAGAAQGLGLQSLMRDMGWEVKLRLHSDATAAIGMCKRKGLGKVRHLATTDLWIQEKVRSGQREGLVASGWVSLSAGGTDGEVEEALEEERNDDEQPFCHVF